MDKCTSIFGVPDECTELTLRTDDEMNQCTQQEVVPEKTHGCEGFAIYF